VKRFVIVSGILLAVFGIFVLQKQGRPFSSFTVVVSPTPNITNTLPEPTGISKTITYAGQTYSYDLIYSDPKSLVLIPNFTQKEPVTTIIDTNKCLYATNGGFYDTKSNPLGYFFTGSYSHKEIHSLLFNGFFTIQNDATPYIGPLLETRNIRLGLQTGPLLFKQGQILDLRIQNDEHARRIVAAVTDKKTIVFITLYSLESTFDGPKLADLPLFINQVNMQENLSITDAINLDGGSASAFYSANTNLSELSSVGSVFCIQNVVQ
jgi:uncharacterized protein YigE (DUF2233 family)